MCTAQAISLRGSRRSKKYQGPSRALPFKVRPFSVSRYDADPRYFASARGLGLCSPAKDAVFQSAPLQVRQGRIMDGADVILWCRSQFDPRVMLLLAPSCGHAAKLKNCCNYLEIAGRGPSTLSFSCSMVSSLPAMLQAGAF